MHELVSIVVTVYKSENYIEKCIKSVVDQSYSNIEIILVLDGVFDQSDIICKKYADLDERIVVIEKSNEGVSIARNIGIEVAHGERIAFVDADDWLEKDYIEKLVSSSVADVDIVICDYYAEYLLSTVKEKFFSTGDCTFSAMDREVLIKNCMLPLGIGNTGGCTNVGVPWAKLYRLDFIKKNNLRFKPGLSRMQDMVFNMYAFSHATSIIYISTPLYHYLKNDISSTVAFRPTFCDTVLDINRAVEEFIDYRKMSSLKRVLQAKNILLIIEIIKLQFVMNPGISTKEKICSIRSILNNDILKQSVRCYDSNLLNTKMKIAGWLLRWNCIEIVYMYINQKTQRQIKMMSK